LEIDVERARTDLNVARTKDDRFNNDLRDLQNRLNAQKPRLVDDDLNKLRALIKNLNNQVPAINDAVNR